MAFTTKSYPELPACAVPDPTHLLGLWNLNTDRLESFPISALPSSTTSQNFEWLSDTTYLEDEIVTYAGKLWQAEQNVPINIVPGTNATYWIEVNKSATWSFWSAGVYIEDEVIVLEFLDGFVQLFRLAITTRPYASSNFNVEYAAGVWELLSERGYIGIQKTAHGFAVNDVLTFKSGNWNKYTTDDKQLAIVRQVVNSNLVIVVLLGNKLKGLTGLAAGAIYYAQPDATIATAVTNVPIFFAISTTEAILFSGGGGTGGGSGGGVVEKQWKFVANTAASDPGNGFFRANNSNISLITQLYFSEKGSNNFDAGVLFTLLEIGGRITIQQTNDSTRIAVYEISAAPTDNGLWWTIPVTVVDHNSLLYVGSAECLCFFDMSKPVPDASDSVKGVAKLFSSVDTVTPRNDGAIRESTLLAYLPTAFRRFPIRVTLNISGAVVIDLSAGDIFDMTIIAAVTSFSFINEVLNKEQVLIFTKLTTEKAFAWLPGKFRFIYGNVPDLTNPTANGTSPAKSVDIFTAVCNVAGRLDVVISPNFLDY